MSQKKVLFIDEVHSSMASQLQELGYLCEFAYSKTREEIIEVLPQYFGVVIRSKFKFNEEVLNNCGQLKWIARSGSGLENIDVAMAEKMQIHCINSPEGNKDAVAEHCIGMLLSLLNHLKRGDTEVRIKQWNREKNRGVELAYKTVGIIGYGNVGSALAQKLSGFGCKVVAYDKYKSGFSTDYVAELSLDEIKAEADIISIHLPQNAETLCYVNSNFIASMQKPFYLINASRGRQVVTEDLLQALDSGKVLGACLDVLEFESTSFSEINDHVIFKELIKRENVLLSPHVAGWTVESYEKLARVLVEKIKQLEIY